MPTYDDGTTPTLTADWHSPAVAVTHTPDTNAPEAVAYALRMRAGKPGGGKGPLVQTDVSGTLATGNDQTIFQPICMADGNANTAIDRDLCGCLKVGGEPPMVVYPDDKTPMVLYEGLLWTVRRLMPVECERIQGFQGGWTDIEYRGRPAADGPRYKAIGNSMAVPVMRWIGERIAHVIERDEREDER